MSTNTGPETISADNPEEPTLFSMPNAPTQETLHPGIVPVEEGGERPVEGGKSIPAHDAPDAEIKAVIATIADSPEALVQETTEATSPVMPIAPGEVQSSNKKRNAIIASIAAVGLAAAGFVGWKLTSGESDTPKSTPVATSSNPVTTQSPTPSTTETAPSPSPTSVPTTETANKPHESYVPNTSINVFTSKINQTRVDALKAQYPELEKLTKFPTRAFTVATPQGIKRQQNLVKSVYANPDMSPWLVNPNNPKDPAYMPWFTSEDIANGSDVDSTAGNPVVAFPDFALEWAFFFGSSNQPMTITPETDKMIRMADMAPEDAASYEANAAPDEAKLAPEGKHVGHAKAVHSDILVAKQTADGRIFVNTVTEYEPGNGEATGRVYDRWSVIAPVNGAIKAAPANADISFNLGEKYLGNATN